MSDRDLLSRLREELKRPEPTYLGYENWARWEKYANALEARLVALAEQAEALRKAIKDLLDVTERLNADPEEWYAARDFARSLLRKDRESEGRLSLSEQRLVNDYPAQESDG